MKTYIIHVSDAYDRELHMQKQLKDKDLDTVYILDGDKKTLTQERINKYFRGEMAAVTNATSCVYKHLSAYEAMLKENDNLALILEDDIRLYKNFSILNDIVREIKDR